MEIKNSDGQLETLDIDKISVQELLMNLGIDQLEVIVKRDSKIILEEEILENKDNIEIIRVIHGG
jgi:sulfur carrier protein ThiS